MYQKVKAYMKEHGMVVDGDVVLAGVSGGGDSMATVSYTHLTLPTTPYV